ncbi:hypothetical protein OAF64_06970 [Crocinitomicaceae bacterium]|nr:hypothetical protein [Crocinitomicaceae bacterium]
MKILFYLLTTFFLLQNLNIFSQEDWKLPMRKGKIQFEFNSEKLNSGNTDLCEFYTATNTSTDLGNQLRNAMAKGKVKFFSATRFTLFPTLYNADMSVGNVNSFQVKCKPGNDTLIGALNITISQVKVGLLGTKIRNGSIKCLYRIILKDDSYNIKLRGFKYTYHMPATLLKPGETKTVALEEEYDEENLTKSDKKFWADIKMCVNLFHSTLEDVLGSQGSDFDFDD